MLSPSGVLPILVLRACERRWREQEHQPVVLAANCSPPRRSWHQVPHFISSTRGNGAAARGTRHAGRTSHSPPQQNAYKGMEFGAGAPVGHVRQGIVGLVVDSPHAERLSLEQVFALRKHLALSHFVPPLSVCTRVIRRSPPATHADACAVGKRRSWIEQKNKETYSQGIHRSHIDRGTQSMAAFIYQVKVVGGAVAARGLGLRV